jgi:predicted phosphodiesterase
MKRLLVLAAAVVLVVVAAANSRRESTPATDTVIPVEERNPWTNLRFNTDPTEFRFAVVSDRTGGHRARIFSQAVEQLNLMQPEFVLSVGDLIEGYSENPEKVAAEWKEFQGYVSRLQIPFFYVAGNHDVTNRFMETTWQDKFGRRYYSFLYRGVLFLCLWADDPPETGGHISDEQIAFAKATLEKHKDARWTVVSIHKPLWDQANIAKNNWLEVEKLLAGRNYTVFAGHVHRFQKFVRQGMNYYQLATTGGGSRLRGVPYGEFDHITWVTMKKDGPVLANLLLDGVYPEDMRRPVTSESGVVELGRKPTQPVTGRVLFEGTPAVGAEVVFHFIPAEGKRPIRAGDALVEGDGSFTLSTYAAFDGAPTGDYIVTVVPYQPPSGLPTKTDPIKLPETYGKPATSPLRAAVKVGKNEFTFELK